MPGRYPRKLLLARYLIASLPQRGVALEKLKGRPELQSSLGQQLVRIYSQEWNAYWRPSGNGYTEYLQHAGIFPFPEAFALTRHCGPEKRIVFETVEPDYSI